MPISSPVAAFLNASSLRFGPMRLTAYGASATVGVLLAMALAGRSARRTGVSPEAAWDTGLFAVLSCFVTSRLLLVLRDPVAFTRFPALVLALPSLTLGGLALAAVVVWLYLRRKHLPLLPMLDLFAPSGALLASALEIGHWIDGSEPGMPIGFLKQGQPWNLSSLRLYPVAALSALAAAALTVLLFRQLTPREPSSSSRHDGRVAALGLMLGGGAAFALSLLSLPQDVLPTNRLEPGQIVALAACIAGGCLWSLAPALSRPRRPVPSLSVPLVTEPLLPGKDVSLPLQTEAR